MSICSKAEKDLRSLLTIPQKYKVLFTQGGASSQFSAVCYNLVSELSTPIDYIITGQWSSKAEKEAKRLGCNTNIVYTNKSGPLEVKDLKFSKNSCFTYYCDNETVDGFELPVNFIDSLPGTVVCDMSSNLLSRQFDITKYGVIFGGAQKNIGPAGRAIDLPQV
jgi:phosphoserine aminotransferase